MAEKCLFIAISQCREQKCLVCNGSYRDMYRLDMIITLATYPETFILLMYY